MNDNKFPSRYSNGKDVSAAQYITELICENKAKQENLDLYYRFWTNSKWASYYQNQIASANKLLKKYNAKSIIRALADKKAAGIYSLRAPHLPAIIDIYEGIIQSENKNFTKNIDRNDISFIRKEQAQKNILSRLREIEDDT
jgi:hypothetical protein